MPPSIVSAQASEPQLADLTYEAALEQLESLIARMESGQMPLDELLSAYQQGAALLAVCRNKLAALEQQIKTLDDQAVESKSGS